MLKIILIMKKYTTIILITLLSLFFINATINLENLFNYENQSTPSYVGLVQSPYNNPITDEVATLGRVLFYDKNLSVNNTVACASCHHQENAFGDNVVQSLGFDNGLTGRHSMRLVNSGFGVSSFGFFWDRRADDIEAQSTMPIKDHVEMGYSGEDGNPNINDLITVLEQKDYYQTLFNFAFDDANITEERIQFALAQFIRSIQSFDSKFDEGLAQVNWSEDTFPNFTDQENMGKQLFLTNKENGGASCAMCHLAPEFSITPSALNNGVIAVAGSDTEIDITNTRAPSLRDVAKPNGDLNGPFMHNGSKQTLLDVINHYNAIPYNSENTDLDPTLTTYNSADQQYYPQQLNLTQDQKDALIAFLLTLSGNDIYTNEKWSDPFESDGSINIIEGSLATQEELFGQKVNVYPNPVKDKLNIKISEGNYEVKIVDLKGKLIKSDNINSSNAIDLSTLSSDIYIVQINNLDTKQSYSKKIIKK